MASDWNDRNRFNSSDEQGRRSGSQLDKGASSPFGADRYENGSSQDRNSFDLGSGSPERDARDYYQRDQSLPDSSRSFQSGSGRHEGGRHEGGRHGSDRYGSGRNEHRGSQNRHESSSRGSSGQDRDRSSQSYQASDYGSREQQNRGYQSDTQNYTSRGQHDTLFDRDRMIERSSSPSSSDSDIYYGRGNFDQNLNTYDGRQRNSSILGSGSRGSSSPMSSTFSRDNDMSSGYSTYGRDSDLGGYSSQQLRTSYSGKGPKGWARSDERIKETVCEALERDHHIDASEIEVEVKEGIITLKGNVEDRRTKRMAEDCVENLSGVKDVRNELHVNASFFEQAKEVLTGESPSERHEAQKAQKPSRSTR